MTLLLLDLDDTLLDRAQAIRSWLEDYVGGGPVRQADVDMLLDLDAGAPLPRDTLAQRMKDTYALTSTVSEVGKAVADAMVSDLVVDPAVRAALQAAHEAGWSPVIVTNGATQTQERKIRETGLDGMVTGWVVSGSAGVWKPDPQIFVLAAERAGRQLADGWMVGDNPRSDIAGAHNAGIRSVWLHHGRAWPDDLEFEPTLTAAGCAEAIRKVIAAR